jgi:hypothetical protein
MDLLFVIASISAGLLLPLRHHYCVMLSHAHIRALLLETDSCQCLKVKVIKLLSAHSSISLFILKISHNCPSISIEQHLILKLGEQKLLQSVTLLNQSHHLI